MKRTIVEMQKAIHDFCDERDWEQYHNPKDLAIGISTEAGELLDLFRFKNSEELKEVMKKRNTDVQDELADIFFYVLRFADLNDIDLDEALANKMIKNAAHYPAALVKGKNKKYNEY